MEAREGVAPNGEALAVQSQNDQWQAYLHSIPQSKVLRLNYLRLPSGRGICGCGRVQLEALAHEALPAQTALSV